MPSMGELISSARARSIRKAALSEEPRAPESERPQCAMGAQWATAAPIAFTPMAMIAMVCRAVPLRLCQMEARAYVTAFGPNLAERPMASHSRAIQFRRAAWRERACWRVSLRVEAGKLKQTN